MNPHIVACVQQAGRFIADVSLKVCELQYAPLPVFLDTNCKFALAAYTHDRCDGERKGNLYFELNRELRQKTFLAQTSTKETWGVFLHYFMSALPQLPDWEGECFRGCSSRDIALQQYELGAEIQWSVFWSTSSSIEVATSTLEGVPQQDRLVFRIWVTSGRDVQPYSFFPVDGEVLLTPNHRFKVTSAPYELEGYLFVDMEEVAGDVFSP